MHPFVMLFIREVSIPLKHFESLLFCYTDFYSIVSSCFTSASPLQLN